MKNFIYFFFMLVLLAGCSVEPIESLDLQHSPLNGDAIAQQGNPHNQFETPTVTAGTSTENSLGVLITAGETGATGGLSVRWMTLEDYETYGWNNDLGGHVLLNGRADASYSLEEGEEFRFYLEDYVTGEGDSWNRALECEQSYVFIVRAHQYGSTRMSEYSDPVVVSTASCEVSDPCNFLEDEYFISYTQDELIGTDGLGGLLEGDVSGLRDIFRSLLDEEYQNYFNISDAELVGLYQYYVAQRNVGATTIELSYELEITQGDCTDSTVLIIVVTDAYKN